MTKIVRLVIAAIAVLVFANAAIAQPAFMTSPVGQGLDSVSGYASATTGNTPCMLVKYVGSTTGKPTVEAAAGGDLTFKLAGAADTTIGSPNLDGIFDLSTPAAAVDTMGELVNLINTTGSNWKAVLVSCLASDLTDNAIFTLSATDASAPAGVPFYREATSASATSIFSAQVAALPSDSNGHASTNMRFWLSGSAVGSPTGSTKINPNPLANWQTFLTNIREKITSTGTIALFEVLGVRRTYDSSGKVSETVRTIWSATGAATTVELAKDYNAGPIVGAPGELLIVRQRTATDLTALDLGATGFMIRRQ